MAQGIPPRVGLADRAYLSPRPRGAHSNARSSRTNLAMQPIIGQFAESLNPTMEAYKRCECSCARWHASQLTRAPSTAWAKPLAAVS